MIMILMVLLIAIPSPASASPPNNIHFDLVAGLGGFPVPGHLVDWLPAADRLPLTPLRLDGIRYWGYLLLFMTTSP